MTNPAAATCHKEISEWYRKGALHLFQEETLVPLLLQVFTSHQALGVYLTCATVSLRATVVSALDEGEKNAYRMGNERVKNNVKQTLFRLKTKLEKLFNKEFLKSKTRSSDEDDENADKDDETSGSDENADKRTRSDGDGEASDASNGSGNETSEEDDPSYRKRDPKKRPRKKLKYLVDTSVDIDSDLARAARDMATQLAAMPEEDLGVIDLSPREIMTQQLNVSDFKVRAITGKVSFRGDKYVKVHMKPMDASPFVVSQSGFFVGAAQRADGNGDGATESPIPLVISVHIIHNEITFRFSVESDDGLDKFVTLNPGTKKIAARFQTFSSCVNVEQMHIASASRKKGFGTLGMAILFAFLDSTGMPFTQVIVVSPTPDGKAFYNILGFTTVNVNGDIKFDANHEPAKRSRVALARATEAMLVRLDRPYVSAAEVSMGPHLMKLNLSLVAFDDTLPFACFAFVYLFAGTRDAGRASLDGACLRTSTLIV